MKIKTNQSRRQTLKRLGALTGALALPTHARSNYDEAPLLYLQSELQADHGDNSDEAAQTDAEESIPMERYGIRQFQAPEIRLDYWIDANGEPTTFSVKEQQGKWLFIKFFQNWCPGCHSLGFPTLQQFATKFKDNPKVEAIAVQTVFEGMDYNTVSAVRELQQRYELPITMGHDVGTELTNNLPLSMINYRSGGTPWLILVSPDGQVVMNDFHMDADILIEFVAQATA